MFHPVVQLLHPLAETERQELRGVRCASSETMNRHRRTIALLTVADGMPLIETARTVG